MKPTHVQLNAVHVPSLVEVDDEHDVVPEAGESVTGRHRYDECKQVINEGIERLQPKN